MITIGLSGWGDHDDIYRTKEAARNKLLTYGKFFGTVELDSSFYAVQPERNMVKWTEETPEGFRFVVKAFQGMTGHTRGKIPFTSEDEMYEAFLLSIGPMRAANKLACVLFQYPPWFDCRREHVDVLRAAKARMGDTPCALEFRHQSWFVSGMRERTLQFMQREGWIHSVCDEPQVGSGSVPTVEEVTDDNLTVVRLHGRNEAGWKAASAPNWRKIRYLYKYNEEELTQWAQRLLRLQQQSEHIHVIFNNNSGGDAAGNARQLMAMLGQPLLPLPVEKQEPEAEQLDLFDWS